MHLNQLENAEDHHESEEHETNKSIHIERGKTSYFVYLKKVILPLALLGLVTGLFSGAIVGAYNYCSQHLVKHTLSLFDLVGQNLKWLPLAFVINIVIGLIIGILIDKFSEIRGSGIPFIESVARGNLMLTWYYSLPLMFVTSLFSLFSGMSLGSEGPSVYMGGCIGYGIGKILKLPKVHYMLLVSAGSAAGLSVAFNAPISGLIFSLEEVYRKFTMQIIVSSVICVAIAQMLLHLIFKPNMLSIGILAYEKFNIKLFGIALFTGLIGGLFGALFNITIRNSPKVYQKIKFLSMKFYVIIPTVLAVILGVWWDDVSCGGAEVMKLAITDKLSLWRSAVSFVVKFLFTCICFGSKASGGIFIPMLSVGSLLGAFLAKLCVLAGMDQEIFPQVVLMCISSFFTGVVRAPLTAVILPVEYTETFSGFCGPITAVAMAYFAAEVTQVMPLYEALMEGLTQHEEEEEHQTYKYSFNVTLESMICGLTVREVILPEETVISRIVRNNTDLIPKEGTQIFEGDEIFFKSETSDPDFVEEQLSMLF